MQLTNKRILVTGGAGFIGSHITEYLLKNGVGFVRIFDNLSTGLRENIDHLLKQYKNLEFYYGDITNLDHCREAMQGIDLVCHQAAAGSVPKSMLNPLHYHNTNVTGFLNILEAVRENGVKRISYASSSSVYGDDEHLPKTEAVIGNQISPYAVTKYLDELYASMYCRLYGLECIGFRYFNVYGPRQRPDGAYAAVIPKFISSLSNGEAPTINGDGSYTRDFTYVDNVVRANVLALTTQNSACFGEAFNIGNCQKITILELYCSIQELMGVNISPNFGQARLGDVPHTLADISKAQNYLGYNPIVEMTEGLSKTVNYFVSRL